MDRIQQLATRQIELKDISLEECRSLGLHHEKEFFAAIETAKNRAQGTEYFLDPEYQIALKMFKRQYYSEKLKDGTIKAEGFLKEQKEYVDLHTPSSYGVFITLNPREGITIDELIRTVENIVSKKWADTAIWSYEQRSECITSVHGIHSHILIFRGAKKPCEIKREVQNTAKKICDVSNPHCLNIQYVSQEHFINSSKYIQGKKVDALKQSKCEVDKLWRKEVKINDFYYHYSSEREAVLSL